MTRDQHTIAMDNSVLNRLARSMAADGYLVLGSAETVVGLTDSFKVVPDKRGLYVINMKSPSLIPSPHPRPSAPPRLVAVNGGR